jgi:hypothetical protein
MASPSSAHRLAAATLAGLGAYLALSFGPWSWFMDVAFLIRGGLSAALILALTRAVPHAARSGIGVGLLWLWAVASGLLAFFPADQAGQQPGTASGGLHVILALAAFLAVPVGQLLAAWGLRAEPLWRPVLGPLLILPVPAAVAFVLMLRTRYAPGSPDSGWARVFVGVALAWFLVAALRILLRHRVTARV